MEFHRRFLKILYKHLHRQIFKSVEGFKDALFLSLSFSLSILWSMWKVERDGGKPTERDEEMGRSSGGSSGRESDPWRTRICVPKWPWTPAKYRRLPSTEQLPKPTFLKWIALFFSSNWASICGPLRSVWFVFFYCLFCVVTFHMKQNFLYKLFLSINIGNKKKKKYCHFLKKKKNLKSNEHFKESYEKAMSIFILIHRPTKMQTGREWERTKLERSRFQPKTHNNISLSKCKLNFASIFSITIRNPCSYFSAKTRTNWTLFCKSCCRGDWLEGLLEEIEQGEWRHLRE